MGDGYGNLQGGGGSQAGVKGLALKVEEMIKAGEVIAGQLQACGARLYGNGPDGGQIPPPSGDKPQVTGPLAERLGYLSGVLERIDNFTNRVTSGL